MHYPDDNGQGGCKKIEMLNVVESDVTTEGEMFALDNFAQLQRLDCKNLVGALAHLYQRNKDSDRSSTTYALASLNCTEHPVHSPYTSGDLAAAVSLCPDLAKVDLRRSADEGSSMTDQELSAFIELRKLVDLQISGRGFTFGSIHPILEKNSSIESLKLWHVSGVEIGAIARLCPRLRILELIDCTGATSDPDGLIDNEIILPTRLEMFHLSNASSFPAEALRILLVSPALTTVHIISCPAMNDGLLGRAFQLHMFTNLARLSLVRCDNVTKAAIDLFMVDQSPLQSLAIISCSQLSNAENRTEWKSRIKRHNWQLRLVCL